MPIRHVITKPQTATVISLWFWGLFTCAELYGGWPVHNQHSWNFSGVHSFLSLTVTTTYTLYFNACTLVPTVFPWHQKMEFKFHFYFSFFFGLVKWNSISISIFRFLSTCDIEKRIWISFFVFRFRRTLKRGFEFRFLFFVFSSLWKADLNFVFRVSFSHHFEKRIWISFFVFALLVIEKQIGVSFVIFAWI